MIGNDIVDLKAAAVESNWRRKGYLEKIFSKRELNFLFTVGNLHQTIWLMWSMKEAAYKARQRQFDLPRSLDWHSLECSLTQISSKTASGVVKAGEISYFTASEISQEKIHTSASIFNPTALQNRVFETDSLEAKRELLRQTANFYSIPADELSIRKNHHGIPYISYENKLFFNRFSFSDHGKFAAFSLSLIMS